jgi:toxin-antitoxin system PIN domain toxin
MILPDVNILVYAYNENASEHARIRTWWEETLNQSRPVAMSWTSILGFIRVATHRRILDNPMHPGQAVALVQSWLGMRNVQIITPGEAHGEILFGLLDHLGTAGDLTTDAHLAALAIEYQAELVSTDVDFARFPRLRWFNPLRVR